MKKTFGGKTGLFLLLLVVLLLVGLPVAVWLDLTNLTETNLNRQASDLNSIIASVRSYYASNVVGRILATPGVQCNRGRDRQCDYHDRNRDHGEARKTRPISIPEGA